MRKVKHYRIVLSLAFCALFLVLLPCRACAAGYKEFSVRIPFTFQNDSAVPHICTAVIEPVDGAPAPEQTEAEAESGSESRFVLRFSRPGIFRYRIYQTEDDRKGVIYDNRIYTVTVAVRNAEKGGLACSMWATLNGEEKIDAIAFVNRGRTSEDKPETPPEEIGGSTKTGDNSRLEMCAVMMAVSALMIAFIIIVEKHKKKEGDGI